MKEKSKPPQERKVFESFEEIDRSQEKLRRRINDVIKLELDKVSFDDANVDSVESRIAETILEIFGPNSSQAEEYRYYKIWHGGYNMGDSRVERQKKFTDGVTQTVKRLKGLIDWLDEKRNYLSQDSGTRRKTTLESLDLHPRIASVSSELYKNGHYSNAVFDASKALVNYVKEKSKVNDKDGAPLMRSVFSRQSPILSFNELKDTSDKDEQEGMMHLFEGAVLALRNPRGHSFLDDSPERALEYIGLLSMLANRLEEAKYAGK